MAKGNNQLLIFIIIIGAIIMLTKADDLQTFDVVNPGEWPRVYHCEGDHGLDLTLIFDNIITTTCRNFLPGDTVCNVLDGDTYSWQCVGFNEEGYWAPGQSSVSCTEDGCTGNQGETITFNQDYPNGFTIACWDRMEGSVSDGGSIGADYCCDATCQDSCVGTEDFCLGWCCDEGYTDACASWCWQEAPIDLPIQVGSCTEGWVGDRFCQDGDVYQNWENQFCEVNPQIFEFCNYGCLNGVCLPAPTGLQEDADLVVLTESYLNVDYSKPLDAVAAVWTVKHGTLPTYDINIPQECFERDAVTLSLRIFTTIPTAETATSIPECLSNSGWIQVGNSTVGGIVNSVQACAGEMTDGDYNTWCAYPGAWTTNNDGLGGAPSGAKVFEEAIQWIEGDTSCTVDGDFFPCDGLISRSELGIAMMSWADGAMSSPDLSVIIQSWVQNG